MNAEEQSPLSEGPGRKTAVWLVAGCTTLVVALGSLFVTSHPLWFDETASLYISREWGAMWETLLHHETNMWLYYILLNLWQTFGRDEATVRSLSILAAAASVPFVWALGRIVFDEKRAVIAAFLFSINIFVIHYSQAARGYTMLLFLVTVSSYLFARAIEQPSLGRWLWYAVVSALAVYAHLFGFLAVGAQLCSLVALERRQIPWKKMIAGAAMFAFLLLPMVIFQSLFTGQADWIERPTLHDIYTAVRSLAGTSLLFLALYVPLTTVAFVGAWKSIVHGTDSRQRWRITYIVLLLIAPVATIVVFSLAVKPMLVPRYLIFCVAPFVILAADGWRRVTRTWLQVFFAIVLVGATARGLVAYYTTPTHEDWKNVASFVSQNGSQGDAVIFYAYFLKIPFEYYFERADINNPAVDLIDVASAPWRGHPGRLSDLPDSDRDRLDYIYKHYRRVWAVLGYDLPAKLGREAESAELREMISGNLHLAGSYEFDEIRLMLYESVASDSSHLPPVP